MSQIKKSENCAFEKYDKFFLDFIEENRKLIEKKTALINAELRDLKEENEKMIIKFSKQFFLNPDELRKQYIKTHTASTSRGKASKSPRIQKYSSRNDNRSSCDSRISQFTNISQNPYKNKNCYKKFYSIKDKLKIEVEKKKKGTGLIDKTNGTMPLFSHNNSVIKTGESILNNEQKKDQKTCKIAKHISFENEDKHDNSQNNNSFWSRKCNSEIILTDKDKAIHTLIKSNLLDLKEKMLFWFVNKNTRFLIPKKKLIEDFKFIIKNKEKQYERKLIFKPSITAQNCLTFIKQIDEDELKQLAMKGNDAELTPFTGEFKVLYALLGITNNKLNVSEMIQNLYLNIFKEYNITSLKQLITNVICDNVNNIGSFQKEAISQIITKYEQIFDSNTYIQQNRVVSFISFILREIVNFIMNFDHNIKQLGMYQEASLKLNSLLLKN